MSAERAPTAQVISFSRHAERRRKEKRSKAKVEQERALEAAGQLVPIFARLSKAETEALWSERPHIVKAFATALLLADHGDNRKPMEFGPPGLHPRSWTALQRRGLARWDPERKWMRLERPADADGGFLTLEELRRLVDGRQKPKVLARLAMERAVGMIDGYDPAKAVQQEKSERGRKRLSARGGRAGKGRPTNGPILKSAQPDMSNEAAKPWEKLGISRTTWYERGKPMPADTDTRETQRTDTRETQRTDTNIRQQTASGQIARNHTRIQLQAPSPPTAEPSAPAERPVKSSETMNRLSPGPTRKEAGTAALSWQSCLTGPGGSTEEME